jgi:hypothetical protein
VAANNNLSIKLEQVAPENEPIPSAVIAVQTFSDFLGFNPQAHILVTDGCFYEKSVIVFLLCMSSLYYTISMNQEILLISSGKQHLLDSYYSCIISLDKQKQPPYILTRENNILSNKQIERYLCPDSLTP